jgi:hypothetical protein
MNRVLSAARLQLIIWPTLLGWPWGVLASSFLINLAVFAMIGDRIQGGPKTGGLVSIYITVLFISGQAITQVFPFALGLSVTRRTFYAATALVLAAESLLSGVLLYLCGSSRMRRTAGAWTSRTSA